MQAHARSIPETCEQHQTTCTQEDRQGDGREALTEERVKLIEGGGYSQATEELTHASRYAAITNRGGGKHATQVCTNFYRGKHYRQVVMSQGGLAFSLLVG